MRVSKRPVHMAAPLGAEQAAGAGACAADVRLLCFGQLWQCIAVCWHVIDGNGGAHGGPLCWCLGLQAALSEAPRAVVACAPRGSPYGPLEFLCVGVPITCPYGLCSCLMLQAALSEAPQAVVARAAARVAGNAPFFLDPKVRWARVGTYGSAIRVYGGMFVRLGCANLYGGGKRALLPGPQGTGCMAVRGNAVAGTQ